jgi:hypothetical protein
MKYAGYNQRYSQGSFHALHYTRPCIKSDLATQFHARIQADGESDEARQSFGIKLP